MPKQESKNSKAIDLALEQIEKQFGKGAIMKMGDNKQSLNIEVIPTGSLSLDLALGIGGIPRGRIIEIYGPESSGKSTLVLHMMAEAQKKGGLVALIDAEHSFDPEYAKVIGLDLNRLLISQPDTGEQALEIAETLVRSNAVDIIAIDSVAALVPKVEIEGEMGEAQMGLQARLMSQALRKLAGAISKSKSCLIFTNQLRMKIGVMFGNPETTPGGMALKFYASVRLDIRRIGQIKEGENIIGNNTKVKVVKNKVSAPFKLALFDIMYKQGISQEGEALDIGTSLGIIQKSGSWYEYEKNKIGQGREAAKQHLLDNPKLKQEIDKKIRKIHADTQ